MPEFARAIEPFYRLKRIIFSLYVKKNITSSNVPYYVLENRTQFIESGIYPINVLRDLAIESVETTHYLMLDGDVVVSSTLEKNIEKFTPVLNDHYSFLLIQLFKFSPYVNNTLCRKSGKCGSLLGATNSAQS